MTCPCGAPLNIRAQFGVCRKCRSRVTDSHVRRRSPIMLADQLVTWAMLRDGDSVAEVAQALRRLPTEVRAIAYGAG